MRLSVLLRAYTKAKSQADEAMWARRYNRSDMPKETRKEEWARLSFMIRRRQQADKFLRMALLAAKEKP